MMPVLYESSETTFESNGIGVLSDATECIVVEERNGSYELTMRYPVVGKRFDDIRQRAIVYAKPSPYREPEPFRIYKISKPSKGIVTVNAHHISYDLSGIPIAPFTAATAQEAFSSIQVKALSPVNNYEFGTDIVKTAAFNLAVPSSIRSIFGGYEGSVLDVYHGEYEYSINRETHKNGVFLHDSRGADNGVIIAYGKNLVTLEQEENNSNVYTGVLPYYYSENDGLVQGNVQNVPGTFDYVNILTYDFSSDFEEKPTVQQLNVRAEKYINDNDIGVPTISLKVSFVDLAKASGYESLGNLETVDLCDIVTVDFERLNIRTKAKVVKITYDVLKDRYKTVEIGKAVDTITDTIAKQQISIAHTPSISSMEKAIKYATELITGNKGGYVVFNDSDNDGFPDEILIMDTPDIATAHNVWRWNKEGLGFSPTGYTGPYTTAITADGTIVADFIKAGTIDADNVKVNGRVLQNYTVPYGSMNAGTQDMITAGVTAASNISALITGSLQASAIVSTNGSFYNMAFNGVDCAWYQFVDYYGNTRWAIGRAYI